MGLLESEICAIMKYVNYEEAQNQSIVMMGKQDILCKGSYFKTMADNFGWKYNNTIMKKIVSKENIDSHEMFATVGFGNVDSLDYSDYEGATIICDLNKPIKKELYEKFDWVVNGGTLEHVFDISTAMNNMSMLVKKGGYICHISPSDGWVNHGFYSISPTFFSDYYENNGFRIISLELEIVCDEERDGVQSYMCGDMRLLGGNERMNRFLRGRMNPGDKALVVCIAQKYESKVAFETPIQGMWKRKYEEDK